MLRGRRAAWNKGPCRETSTIERRGVERLRPRAVVVMFERVERRIKRPKRVAEEAVLRLVRSSRRIRPDVMSALVVCDGNRHAGDVRIVDMQQRQAACPETCEQQEGDTGVPDPGPTAEHQFQLNDWSVLRQAPQTG